MKISRELKVAIIGCGRVGTTVAFAMMLDGTPTDLVLVDRDIKKAQGEKEDLEEGMPLLDFVNIEATDDIKDIAGSSIVVISAGVAQKPGETRLDLVKNNKAVLESIITKVNQAAPEAVIIIVSNPVDVLTYHACKLLNRFDGTIFGTGTLLDTLRFKHFLAEETKVNPKSIHAYILGEHGDSSFPVYENATVGGQKLLDFPGIDKEVVENAYQNSRTAAYRMIESKGATYYAIAVVVTKIMEAIFSDAKTIFPLSVPLINYRGFDGVALSVPCVLGANGVERILDVDMSKSEEANMRKAVASLKEYCV